MLGPPSEGLLGVAAGGWLIGGDDRTQRTKRCRVHPLDGRLQPAAQDLGNATHLVRVSVREPTSLRRQIAVAGKYADSVEGQFRAVGGAVVDLRTDSSAEELPTRCRRTGGHAVPGGR